MKCKQCILPENYPEISFNNEGICNYCLNYKAQEYLGEEAFVKLLDSIKGKGRQYDCLVPVSGGRDSAFVLCQMKNRFDMNILAYNYDNGFVSSVAKENIRKAVAELDVELVRLKSKRNIQCKHLRHVTKLALHKSPVDVLFNLCSGCGHGIWGGAYKIAMEKKIPLVVFGESKMESGTAKQIFGNKIKRNKKDKIKDAVTMPLNFLIRKYHSVLLEKEFPLRDFTDIKKVNFFDYLEWDENKIENTIRNEIGWQVEEGMLSWRFDCKIHVLVDYMHRRLFGFTEKTELYSKMIREGKITREDALARVTSGTEKDKKEMEIIGQVFDILKLNQKERDAILNLETLK